MSKVNIKFTEKEEKLLHKLLDEIRKRHSFSKATVCFDGIIWLTEDIERAMIMIHFERGTNEKRH